MNGSDSLQWFMASFVTHRRILGATEGVVQAQEYSCLLTAADSSAAYQNSLDLAKMVTGKLAEGKPDEWEIDGISELLIVAEPPEVGSELSWTQQELTPKELEQYVNPKEQLSAFRHSRQSWPASGWYVCRLVLVEVHDTGDHGETLLVWTDSHLIMATDATSAHMSAVELGTRKAFESGAHRCDGDNAHWEFRGLRDLVETVDPPRDGGILLCEELAVSLEQLYKLIPPRENLSVFEWEARRHLS